MADLEYLKSLSADPVCFTQHRKRLTEKQIELVDRINHNKKIMMIQSSRENELELFDLLNYWMLWTVMMSRSKTFYISPTLYKSKEVISKITEHHEKYYTSLGVNKMLCRTNKRLTFDFGGSIQTAVATTDVLRGEELNLLVIDRFEYIDDIENIWMSIWPTIISKGKCIVVSEQPNIELFDKHGVEYSKTTY